MSEETSPESRRREPLCRTKSNRFHKRRLGAAAAAIASAGVPASEALATIIPGVGSHQGGDTFAVDAAFAVSRIEIAAMGGMNESLALQAAMGGMGTPASTIELAINPVGAGMNQVDFVDKFVDDGTMTVNDSLDYASSAFMLSPDNTNPDWTVGDIAYAGFRFDIDPTAAVSYVYGWLKVEYLNPGTDLVITEWAYENDGNEILVAAIPEPGTALLLGLGLVGLSLYARRVQKVSARCA